MPPTFLPFGLAGSSPAGDTMCKHCQERWKKEDKIRQAEALDRILREIAQTVEQVPEEHRVEGAIPSLPTSRS